MDTVVMNPLVIARAKGELAGAMGEWKDRNPYYPDSPECRQWELARAKAYKDLLQQTWETLSDFDYETGEYLR